MPSFRSLLVREKFAQHPDVRLNCVLKSGQSDFGRLVLAYPEELDAGSAQLVKVLVAGVGLALPHKAPA